MTLLAWTLGLYALLELLFHGISYGVARIMEREARKQGLPLEPSRAHWQAIFYRLFAVAAIALMSHWYAQAISDVGWKQALAVVAVICLVMTAVIGTDISIIQHLKKQSATHFVNMREMSLLHILRHLPAHRHWYFSKAYLPYARRANFGVGLLSLLLLYLDLRAYYAA